MTGRGEESEHVGPGRRVRRQSVTAHVDYERGVFMISVAAELAEMHPQTLRMYEAKGLITPKRSPKNTRLYSQSDVERLRRIQQMTSEEGLNLAGVETVLELEVRVEQMRAEIEQMRERTAELELQMEEEVERAHRSLRGELVPYGAYDVLAPRSDDLDRARPSEPEPAEVKRTVSIPVTRRQSGK